MDKFEEMFNEIVDKGPVLEKVMAENKELERLKQLEGINLKVEEKAPYTNPENKILIPIENTKVEPQLNSYVWIKFHYSFSKVKVVAKGTDIFVHEGCFDNCKLEEFRRPISYDSYKKKWFKNLNEIREKYKIKKFAEDYYEVVEE